MNIKTRPLMIGAGAGALLLAIVSVIVQAGNYYSLSALVDTINDPNAALGGVGISTLVSCIGLICPTIVVIAAGYIYGHLAGQEMPMETQDAAIGGGATGAAAGIVYGVINAILGIIISQFFLADALGEFGDLAGTSGVGALGGAVGGIAGGLFSACCWLVAGGVLGAIGGIIANAVSNRGKA